VAALGQPRYRADQLWHWLYRRLAPTFDVMANLPTDLRSALDREAGLHTISPVTAITSADALAEKVLFGCADGQTIETVLMHFLDPADATAGGSQDSDRDGADGPRDASALLEPRPPVAAAARHTVCLSTQVGCAMGCVFCATGQMGLVRDLDVGECVEQVVWCARRLAVHGSRLGNVVFMGMGEPLANWSATWGTVNTLCDPDGLAMSPRRLTISTVGIVPGIRRLAAADKPVRLAVSLHAPDDALRRELVPMHATYDLAAILAACRDYQGVGGRRVSFEYVLIRGVNDHPVQARQLAARLLGLRAHVNLIPLNPTAGCDLVPSPPKAVRAFEVALRSAGVTATARLRRGIEIEAGCGQLRSAAAARGKTLPPRGRAEGAAHPDEGRKAPESEPHRASGGGSRDG
jgi:23S rRNA (adenine2503-C2)-methyltransferase